jgi:hypothetical protein
MKKRMPGFNADASFHKASEQYRQGPVSTDNVRNSQIVPSYSRLCLAMVRGCYIDYVDWCCERVVRYCGES